MLEVCNLILNYFKKNFKINDLLKGIFISLFANEHEALLDTFKNLGVGSKWNVLKNLVYFAFKFALFQMIDLNQRGCKSSMGMILNSVYQYVKCIDQI